MTIPTDRHRSPAEETLDAITADSGEQSLSLPGTFALWLGANVVVTTILTGMLLVPALDFATAMMIVASGSALGILPLVLIGVMGQRTGLTTMVLARATFGRIGAGVPAWVNLLALIAWSWIQARLAGMSLDYAISELTGYSNLALFTVICEALVVLVVLGGHRGIERVEKIAAVLMLVLALIVAWALGSHYDMANLLSAPAQGGISLSGAFDIVIATAFSWIPLAADYNRHCRSTRVAALGTWSGYVSATLIAMGLGGAVSGLAMALGREPTYDPTQLLSGFGFGLPAAMVIFFSVLTTNVMCVYSATLSYMSTRSRSGFRRPALIIGVLTVLGAMIPGILEEFQTFLLIIGSVFIPAFSLMIVDYYLLGEQGLRYSTKCLLQTDQLPAINPVALLAYLLGATLAYYWNWVSPLAMGASLPVFVVTGLLYWIGMSISGRRKAI
ncbi:putative hydroxymethylpyrimidine transporter CytX [Kushneria avicenniae]|uniref:Putative hydroxymethylpyrimidine transporter CytX n=1 Tax=Kushneria avicenniae TaxID=402385 RepID=A0A1I1MKX6_9GAMM|nr:cytosine permease [Kushneria avicenniae]SFC86087.1 putative hydroxymethylpyrimidine transporter CytX [Kushneria avicenniae]